MKSNRMAPKRQSLGAGSVSMIYRTISVVRDIVKIGKRERIMSIRQKYTRNTSVSLHGKAEDKNKTSAVFLMPRFSGLMCGF